MTNEPLITLIVPVFRAEAYLSICLDSVLSQTHRNIEVILIDDGSPDGSGAICDAYAAKDARVRVFHQENKGVSAARNTGLAQAKGAYISFVDADDWVEPDYLSYLLKLLLDHDVALSACNHFVYARERDHAKYPVNHEVCILTQRQSAENLLYHLPPDASPWGKLYARELFDELRYPEGMLFEDTYLIADLVFTAAGVAFGSEPKYHYRFQEQTISKGTPVGKRWDYLLAADHLAESVLLRYPDLSAGCTRRRVHAAMSIRRLFVYADASAAEDLARCTAIIRAGAKSVLLDLRAPMRDKAGVLLALAGPRIFDRFWDIYGKIRNRY
ncbi:MAG TPA: glycosyltransferase [Clostridia bacterium]|nr:glycosyltransferase [Clostridia bacterium]